MADEDKAKPESAPKSEKTFNLKAIIVFMLVLVVWTAGIIYFFKGDKGKAAVEETHTNTQNLERFAELLLQQSQVPPIKIVDMVVQIKLDKNGDTSKLLSCGFAFHLGLTQKEQKAIDENKWPPSLESTRFAHGDLTEEIYIDTKIKWSLKDELVGKSDGGGGHGGGGGKGPIPHSYVAYVTNMEDELKEKILHTLMQTTYSQINTEDGRNQILEQLKNEANSMLKNLGKYPRVYKVSLISFFFQP